MIEASSFVRQRPLPSSWKSRKDGTALCSPICAAERGHFFSTTVSVKLGTELFGKRCKSAILKVYVS